MVVGPLFFHESFTRPQRVLCLGVCVTGVMSFNAIIYGQPPHHEFISSEQFVASGVLSSLVILPLYEVCAFMFASRPTSLKRRLIKRAADISNVDAIQKVRGDMERKTAMMPPLP
eukprot:3982057-Amphidinium_carterae.1